jgi:hypothetical protein
MHILCMYKKRLDKGILPYILANKCFKMSLFYSFRFKNGQNIYPCQIEEMQVNLQLRGLKPANNGYWVYWLEPQIILVTNSRAHYYTGFLIN